MNKQIKLTPKKAEKLQDEIFKKMSAAKKIKIASQLFLLGQKLNALKNEKNNNAGKTSLQNRKDFRRP